MRYSIPYRIFADVDKIDMIDMEKVWEIINDMSSPIPEVLNILYGTKGDPTDITLAQASRQCNLSYSRVVTCETKVFRSLRHPYQQKKYMKKGIREDISLKDFTSKELLAELADRLAKYEQS